MVEYRYMHFCFNKYRTYCKSVSLLDLFYINKYSYSPWLHPKPKNHVLQSSLTLATKSVEGPFTFDINDVNDMFCSKWVEWLSMLLFTVIIKTLLAFIVSLWLVVILYLDENDKSMHCHFCQLCMVPQCNLP